MIEMIHYNTRNKETDEPSGNNHWHEQDHDKSEESEQYETF